MFILGVGLLVASASAGFAQDMPLFTFAKLGEKWEKSATVTLHRDLPKAGKDEPLCRCLSWDGATLYVGYADRAAVWAYPLKPDRTPDWSAGAPYAPLRVEAGYDNSREGRAKRKAAALAVTAVICDPSGRLYAGTEKGVHVFDPTGRLCGVLPLPKPGVVTAISWSAAGGGAVSELHLELDGTTWERKMK